MGSDSVLPGAFTADVDVMASVEEGRVETLVIADVSQDEAYLTLPLTEAASLPAWR